MEDFRKICMDDYGEKCTLGLWAYISGKSLVPMLQLYIKSDEIDYGEGREFHS